MIVFVLEMVTEEVVVLGGEDGEGFGGGRW